MGIEDLDGWELYDSSEMEVSIEQGCKRQLEIRKTYTKKIDGVWYYKKTIEVIPVVRREYKDIDGERESFYEWTPGESK